MLQTHPRNCQVLEKLRELLAITDTSYLYQLSVLEKSILLTLVSLYSYFCCGWIRIRKVYGFFFQILWPTLIAFLDIFIVKVFKLASGIDGVDFKLQDDAVWNQKVGLQVCAGKQFLENLLSALNFNQRGSFIKEGWLNLCIDSPNLLIVLEVAKDFVLLVVVFSLFIQWLQSFLFLLNHHGILQETITLFYIFLKCLEPPLIFLFAVALDGGRIPLYIENATNNTFEELLSLAEAMQVFAHAEEKMESVF